PLPSFPTRRSSDLPSATVGSPTATFTPTPPAPVLIYMVHYTQYDAANRGDEAVRLVNVTEGPVVLDQWQVVDSSGSVALPAGVTLPAGGKIWIANRATVFRGEFGFNPDFEYGADTDPTVPQAIA